VSKFKKISMTVENQQSVYDALMKYGQKAEKEIAKAVVATALTVNRDVKRAIQGPPKTGTIYSRGSKNHQASAPKEAPATDTGALVSSIYFKQPNNLTAEIGSRLPYAYYLEFGTKNMEPRPSWLPATEKNTPLFQKLIDAALRRAAQ
jgi:phage gpG-like protein